MKKTMAALFAVVVMMLSGCTVYHEINIQSLLNQRIRSAEKTLVFQADNNKKFYSYYISPEIGRLEGDSTGNIFDYQGTSFLMNLNISSVINQKYYNGISDDPDILRGSLRKADLQGKYQDLNGNVHKFAVSVYDIGNQNYLTAMRTDTVDFCAVSDALKAADIAGEMLKIARTVNVHADAVATAYSRKETVTFTGEKIQLFDSVAPESGRVEELFDDNDTAGNTDESASPEPSETPQGE